MMTSLDKIEAALAQIERMDGELEAMRQSVALPLLVYPIIVTVRASLLGLMAFLDAEARDIRDGLSADELEEDRIS